MSMTGFDAHRSLLRYNDWANEQIERAAAVLSDEQLDRPFEMGMVTLRKTMQHIRDAECVWLKRWQAQGEVPWPADGGSEAILGIGEQLRRNARERDAFLTTVGESELTRVITYRDSKGSRFQAALGDMILQMCVHSTHHRAQAVNMLRRLGASPPELDYMYHVRKPA
jgi:uncharacterized damage-inducible protein DinB